MTKSKGQGGVGVKDPLMQNEALGAKLVWKMYRCQKDTWCKVLKDKHLHSLDSHRILIVANP